MSLTPVYLEVNLDDILDRIGVFGKWQQKIVFMLLIASFIGGSKEENEILPSLITISTNSGLTVMNTAVTAAVPDQFRCYFPDCWDHMVDGQIEGMFSTQNCKFTVLNSHKC